MTSKYTRIEQLIEPAAQAFGCRLYGLEFTQSGRNQTVRVLIEGEQGPIGIDDVSRVSKQIRTVLNVAEIISGEYVLEVSSPGLDRPLFKHAHYLSAIGNKISISLLAPVAGRRNFHGILTEVSDNTVTLHDDEATHVFPLSEVQKARVVPDLTMGRGKKQ